MTRVILSRVGDYPHVTWLRSDLHGGDLPALTSVLGDLVACIAVHRGIELWCNQAGLAFGLTLVHRTVLLHSSQYEIMSQALKPDDGSKPWPTPGDFVLARSTEDGKLADLTDADIEDWLCAIWHSLY